MSDALPGTTSAATAIARVSYTHDAMIDLLIANPSITNNALAAHFNYTPAWVSRIKNSDAFQERLAARRTELVDPGLLLTVEEKLSHLAHRGLDILAEKLEGPASMIPMDTAMKAVEISSRALGYGARAAGQTNVQNNFVVALPAQATSESAWAAACTPGGVLESAGGSFGSSTGGA